MDTILLIIMKCLVIVIMLISCSIACLILAEHKILQSFDKHEKKLIRDMAKRNIQRIENE